MFGLFTAAWLCVTTQIPSALGCNWWQGWCLWTFPKLKPFRWKLVLYMDALHCLYAGSFFFFQFLHAHDRMNDQPSFHHLHHLTITSFRHPLDLPSGFTKGCSPSPSARRRNKGGFRLVPWTQNDITDGYLFVMFGCLSVQQNWAKPFWYVWFLILVFNCVSFFGMKRVFFFLHVFLATWGWKIWIVASPLWPCWTCDLCRSGWLQW